MRIDAQVATWRRARIPFERLGLFDFINSASDYVRTRSPLMLAPVRAMQLSFIGHANSPYKFFAQRLTAFEIYGIGKTNERRVERTRKCSNCSKSALRLNLRRAHAVALKSRHVQRSSAPDSDCLRAFVLAMDENEITFIFSPRHAISKMNVNHLAFETNP